MNNDRKKCFYSERYFDLYSTVQCKFAFYSRRCKYPVKKDSKEMRFFSDSSIPEAATFFPMSAIVRPILEDRAYRKAGMPDYQNVKKIEAIPSA